MNKRMTKKDVIRMAREQGCAMQETSTGHIDIAPRGLKRCTIRFWESGTVTDLSVPCCAQKSMTIAATISALRLSI